MKIVKIIVFGWIALSVLTGGWMLITGNTSEEAMVANQCEDALEDLEGLYTNELLVFGSTKAKLYIKAEYNDDIPPKVEYKRGARNVILCRQLLETNHSDFEAWVTVALQADRSGDIQSELVDYDIYDKKEDLWWSEL